MRLHHRPVDASVGASGPHDFAVRFKRHSSRALSTSIASRLAFVTIATAPLVEAGCGELVKVICPTGKAENFC
jgi:hypothetical protein